MACVKKTLKGIHGLGKWRVIHSCRGLTQLLSGSQKIGCAVHPKKFWVPVANVSFSSYKKRSPFTKLVLREHTLLIFRRIYASPKAPTAVPFVCPHLPRHDDVEG